jgi:hypothetical protein
VDAIPLPHRRVRERTEREPERALHVLVAVREDAGARARRRLEEPHGLHGVASIERDQRALVRDGAHHRPAARRPRRNGVEVRDGVLDLPARQTLKGRVRSRRGAPGGPDAKADPETQPTEHERRRRPHEAKREPRGHHDASEREHDQRLTIGERRRQGRRFHGSPRKPSAPAPRGA